jgi:hypothetical protein
MINILIQLRVCPSSKRQLTLAMKLAFTVNMFDRKHSWIYRDVFWFVFVWSLARFGEAESKCTEAFFKQIDGAYINVDFRFKARFPNSL